MILTAEKLFISVVGKNPDEFNGYIKECMIEFAKLHVEATLESAAKNTKEWHGNHGMLKQSILNAYPLTNIK